MTKIIATIGPASQSTKILSQMLQSGMAVARFNYSHGSFSNHSLLFKNIGNVSKKFKKPIITMQDLQGPKIRISNLRQSVIVKTGKQVILGKDFDIDLKISHLVKPGQQILIEDGLVELVVQNVKNGLVYCQAKNDGIIQSHKGVNLPQTQLDIPSMTPKDIADLKFGLTKNYDLVALSFVRTAEDVLFLKDQIKKYLPKGQRFPKIVVKIEKPEAVKNFDSILKQTDWVMVARGDLGVEVPASHVPLIQRMIIKKCHQAKKPVIVATQMLDSMIRNPRPTRAEVSDVANAVLEGADFTMLSGETAFGKYPLESVKQMQDIIKAVSNPKLVI